MVRNSSEEHLAQRGKEICQWVQGEKKGTFWLKGLRNLSMGTGRTFEQTTLKKISLKGVEKFVNCERG